MGGGTDHLFGDMEVLGGGGDGVGFAHATAKEFKDKQDNFDNHSGGDMHCSCTSFLRSEQYTGLTVLGIGSVLLCNRGQWAGF